MALYPYTLQPVALNLTETEFKQAQLELFEQSNSSYGLNTLKTKEWIVIAVVVALAIAGLVFVSGYSTILFWVMLVLVVLYLVIRTIGMRWYVKQEFEKQMAEQHMPEEMKSLKLGVQQHGLVISMPAPNAGVQPKAMRGMQMRASSQQQAVIPWSAITSWEETDDYLFMLFELKGQKGSQIIPKRLQTQKFPFDTVRKHLKEVVPTRGLQTENITQ
ncbi:YcxB family protein [Psychrobacter sp. I-STPA6b]|uniref:YcxB family protein n=1 Tax=Psychrobacter sp. I-STPA6b TaxID=2585718 RepID=UPI001D0C2654|nr:YcxB family protein [Psychrobacter sp. I-STPA6b]